MNRVARIAVAVSLSAAAGFGTGRLIGEAVAQVSCAALGCPDNPPDPERGCNTGLVARDGKCALPLVPPSTVGVITDGPDPRFAG